MHLDKPSRTMPLTDGFTKACCCFLDFIAQLEELVSGRVPPNFHSAMILGLPLLPTSRCLLQERSRCRQPLLDMLWDRRSSRTQSSGELALLFFNACEQDLFIRYAAQLPNQSELP
jgi:hypothetical protein